MIGSRFHGGEETWEERDGCVWRQTGSWLACLGRVLSTRTSTGRVEYRSSIRALSGSTVLSAVLRRYSSMMAGLRCDVEPTQGESGEGGRSPTCMLVARGRCSSIIATKAWRFATSCSSYHHQSSPQPARVTSSYRRSLAYPGDSVLSSREQAGEFTHVASSASASSGETVAELNAFTVSPRRSGRTSEDE